MEIKTLGEAKFISPVSYSVNAAVRIPFNIQRITGEVCAKDETCFELAGPRAKIFFDPAQTRAAIVTCGGLCPGLNNVIRSLFLELHHIYKIQSVTGFRYGYQGLDPKNGLAPIVLTPEIVEDIHKEGGSILGTSRGPVDVKIAIDNLIARKINILFTVGGDGTQRGSLEFEEEARRRGFPLAIIGIPKTIDNDVMFVSRTFGYLTAMEESARVIDSAHTEVHSVQNGIAIVKLMGRQAGFIAAGATIASQDVNFTLIPEVPFKLDGEKGFLAALKKRVLARNHAVIVVAEGAGQDLIPGVSSQKDASGNVKLKDIGVFLREAIEKYFQQEQVPIVMRYFDPSYLIRSRPADAEDSVLCDLFARNAAHAAMSGKTGIIIGLVNDTFVHVPIAMLAGQKKRINTESIWWRAVLAATGQPEKFV